MQPATMIEIVRLNEHNDFKAIFTGILSADAREITGHVVNSGATAPPSTHTRLQNVSKTGVDSRGL